MKWQLFVLGVNEGPYGVPVSGCLCSEHNAKLVSYPKSYALQLRRFLKKLHKMSVLTLFSRSALVKERGTPQAWQKSELSSVVAVSPGPIY